MKRISSLVFLVLLGITMVFLASCASEKTMVSTGTPVIMTPEETPSIAKPISDKKVTFIAHNPYIDEPDKMLNEWKGYYRDLSNIKDPSSYTRAEIQFIPKDYNQEDSEWKPEGSSHAWLKMDGQYYWLLIGGSSYQTNPKESVFTIYEVKPIKDGSYQTLLDSMPNKTETSYQGYPEIDLPKEKMSLAQAVKFMKENNLWGVICEGNAGQLLYAGCLSISKIYRTMDQWQYKISLNDGRSIEVMKAQSGKPGTCWTHLRAKYLDDYEGKKVSSWVGLDSKCHAGALYLFNRNGSIDGSFDEGLERKEIGFGSKEKYLENNDQAKPSPSPKSFEVEGTVIIVSKMSDGTWQTVIKSKTQPPYIPSERPAVRVIKK